jgi:hypothetical protein
MDDPSSERLPIVRRGRFWFAEHPTLVLSGELTVSGPQLFDLSLVLPHYGLQSPGYWESMMGKAIPVILGTDENGRPLSCLDCLLYSSSASYKAPRVVEWHDLKIAVNRCVFGAHIRDQTAVRITRFSSFFTGLTDWASSRNHVLLREAGDDGTHSSRRSDDISGFGRIEIWRAGGGRTTFGDVATRMETSYWRPAFTPEVPVSIEQMLDVIRKFQTLLSLLQGSRVGFNNLLANVTDADVAPHDIEFLVMMPGYKSRVDKAPHSEAFVKLELIEDCWANVVTSWFADHEKIAAPLNLYFATIFAAELFDDHKVLFLAQALEGYHRCRSGVKNAKFADRLAALFTPVSDVLRGSDR